MKSIATLLNSIAVFAVSIAVIVSAMSGYKMMERIFNLERLTHTHDHAQNILPAYAILPSNTSISHKIIQHEQMHSWIDAKLQYHPNLQDVEMGASNGVVYNWTEEWFRRMSERWGDLSR